MGSLRCPLCCEKEFPNRRALQQHLLDVLDLLKCPSCSKSFTSILGLVQHLSLSSCNVEVGVNFDEHFVTYVDCSFMKNTQENKTARHVESAKTPNRQVESVPVSEVAVACSSPVGEMILPDSGCSDDMGIVIDCGTAEGGMQGDIICINLEQISGVTGIEVVEGGKVLQKTSIDPAPSETSVQQDAAKKENVVPKSSENKNHLLQEP